MQVSIKREPTAAEQMEFLRACNLLRNLTERGWQLYLSGSTLCLMRGDSHDKAGRPQRDNIVESALIPGAGGGDW